VSGDFEVLGPFLPEAARTFYWKYQGKHYLDL